MADDRLTFEKATEYWLFCVPRLLADRFEHARVLARTEGQRELVVRMLDRYLTEARMERRRMAVEGDEAGAAAADLVLQRGHDGRYAGPLRHGRFQVMESLTPAGTYYVADHALPDLLLREAGPLSEVRRFGTIAEAEDHTDRAAERPPDATHSARRRGELNMLPTGKPQQKDDFDMAKPKKMETPPKTPAKKAAAPAPAKKAAAPAPAPAPAPVKNGEGRGRAPTFAGTAKIKLLVKENPCRKGTGHAERFDLYRDGMTVADFVAKGGRRGDVGYDVEHGFIAVG